MDIETSNPPPEKTISVMIRVTPEMHAQLTKIAEKIGWGVATVMRQIVQNALDEGINIKGQRKGARSSNGQARPA